MITVGSIADLDLPRHGTIGLMPTMGALHEGHAALFAAARPECDVLVASLFVNPAQFSDDTDLARYPRDNLAIVAHGTVIALFVAACAGIAPHSFWRRLGLPSFVVLSLPERSVLATVERVGAID